MKRLFYILVFLFSASSIAQNGSLFEQGKERYKQEKYQEAIASWMKIVENGEHSANLYFNLGNAHYKLNNVGPSIYYYEKAAQLSPLDRDIKTNLAFAENSRIDAIEPLPKTIFSKWHKAISGLLSFDGWAWVGVSFSALFALLFLLYYFSTSESRKRILFVSSSVSFLLFLGSLVMAFQVQRESLNDNPAIIFAESIEVKSEPKMGSTVAFILHEGTKVQIIEQDDNWVQVKLVNGKDGWLPATDLKPL
jgi:tetratricopeptide (TPR) repeat protein